MRRIVLAIACAAGALSMSTAAAQEPTPAAASIPRFPSELEYLRAWPGVEVNSWYVYASGFTPRENWALVEVFCDALPCAEFSDAPANIVQEEGTMAFYERLPARQPDDRIMALVRPDATEVPADAPHIQIAGNHPGGGYGYPIGTLTGIAAVDEVVAITQALDTDEIRSRLLVKEGITPSGNAVRGLATWQCSPYIQSEDALDEFIDYSSGLIYAVFRVPDDPDLPLRYHDAAYGIVWAPHGSNDLAGIPLSGTALVSEDGRIVGLEARCGTTPGFHVRNFTDFILAPYDGPPVPEPPSVGDSLLTDEARSGGDRAKFAAVIVGSVLLAGAAWTRRRSL